MKARRAERKTTSNCQFYTQMRRNRDVFKQKLSRYIVSRPRIKEILTEFFRQEKNDLTCKHGNAGRNERYKPV